MFKVSNGQDPYSAIGKYIRDHITAIEDMIAVIRINEVETNQLFTVDINEENYFIWKNDWWEGEEDVTLIDFFPVSEAQRDDQSVQSADTISRQAAIDVIKGLEFRQYMEFGEYIGEDTREVRLIRSEKALDALQNLPSAQPESTRTFVELVVEYPDPELCTYKEYKGKPYYSIKYIENGKTLVGYGTYKPEVLSQYMKEYFISAAQSELMDDPINRQTAIEALYSVLFDDDLKPIMVSSKQADKILDAIRKAPTADREEFEWCTDCKEYDQEAHCCHRYTKVIRQAVSELNCDNCGYKRNEV